MLMIHSIPCVPKIVPDFVFLMLYFEAVTPIILLESLGFPVSQDMYNSFDTLFICFHDLMNKWQ